MKLITSIQNCLTPYISEKKALKKAEKFVRVLAHEIANQRNSGLKTQDGNIQYYASLDNIKRKCGVFRHNGKNHYVSNTVLKLGNSSGVDIIEKGSNLTGKLSLIQVNATMQEIMSYYKYEDLREQHLKTLDETPSEHVWTTTIQVEQLSKYAIELEEKLEDSNLEKWRRVTLTNELHSCMQILVCSEEENDQRVLRQTMTKSPFGARLYLTGINLQNCPKNVRKKALSGAHQYDVKAASYCLLYALYREICTLNDQDQFENISSEAWACYEAYTKNREKWRLKVFEDLYGKHSNPKSTRGYYAVKEAFTALGFGARASGNVAFQHNGAIRFGALNSIFGDKILAQKFVANQYVASIIECLKEIMDKVFEQFKDTHEIVTGFPCPDKNGKISKSRLIAHVYQSFESMLLSQSIDAMGKHNVALPVHDCIVTYTRDSNSEIAQIYNNFSPLLKIEHQQFSRNNFEENNNEILTHSEFMKQQEELANQYQACKHEYY